MLPIAFPLPPILSFISLREEAGRLCVSYGHKMELVVDVDVTTQVFVLA